MMKRNLLILLTVMFVISFAGCGGSGLVVKKDAAKGVKRLAIYSIYSNQTIYNRGGGGGLTGLMSLAKSASRSEKSTAGPNNLLKYAYSEFSSALEKTNGWQVMPRESLANSNNYKSKREGVNNKKMFAMGLYGLEDILYHPVGFDKSENPKTICDELNVDAIAYIGLDFAYSAFTAIGGMGTAKASTAVKIVIIDKNGQKVVDTTYAINKGNGIRYASNSKTGLIAGNIILNAQSEGMYKESIDNAIADIIKNLNEGLKG